jgi:hypothetical protein
MFDLGADCILIVSPQIGVFRQNRVRSFQHGEVISTPSVGFDSFEQVNELL